ncbi:MAG TPA: putative lipid II flippase FtsW [Candidatus Binatia bacterium]|nr:putative lipid II flippase FtsW [Candidatus Binatia bacterium]
MQLSASRHSAPPDTVLFSVVAALVSIGLIMIFSASSATAWAAHRDTAFYLKRQLLWLAVALVPAYVAYRCDYRALRPLAPWALVISVLTLLVVLIPHLGLVSGGARRWLGAGPFSFQPSEFVKLGLVVYLSAALSTKGDRIRSLTYGLFPLLAITFALAALVFLEPDVGTASLLVFTAIVMLFVAGARVPHLMMVALATIPALAIAILSSPYKRARILAFLDPWKDRQDAGFHIVQSLLALGSGGLFGVGLGASRQKFFYLPEQYTDFIFSILGEELGLLGALVVVVLFVILAYRAIRIALRAPDRFGFFLAVGCTSLIVIQAFINIGVVTSSWPVTGVPLPFVSFGGSSLVVSLVAVALLINIGRQRSPER